MALFQLWPPRSEPNFSPNGPAIPEPGGPPGNNYLTPQLQVDVDEEWTVSLSQQPAGVQLVVAPQKPGIVKVETVSSPNPSLSLFKLTGLKGGVTLVEARMPLPNRAGTPVPGGFMVAGSVANLNVTVVEEDDSHAGTFVSSFRSGIAVTGGDTADIILSKIDKDPRAFGEAVEIGCARGLLEGLVSLARTVADILKIAALLNPSNLIMNTTRYVFDAEFRATVTRQVEAAKSLAVGAAAMATEVALHSRRYTAVFNSNSGMIGYVVGMEMGRELNISVQKMNAAQMGEWVGFIIGRVMFEILFLVGTEGLGMAAGTTKVAGEGAGIAARLLSRLERLLPSMDGLNALFRTKVPVKVIEEAGTAAKVIEMSRRHRATASELRAMLADSDNTFVWGNHFKDVVANQKILYTGRTNPNAPERLHLLKGRMAIVNNAYGEFKVAINVKEYGGIRSMGINGRAEEFYYPGELEVDEAMWFCDEDLRAIGAK